MGWIAITKDGETLREETHGRPVLAGEEGKLLVIAQEDYGHSVAVDLINGIIALDYKSLGLQNNTVELDSPQSMLWICDETTIVGELAEYDYRMDDFIDESGNKIITSDGTFFQVKTDILTPLIWRPIWFSRVTNGVPTKVIGAQTTLPVEQGGGNVKKMVSLFVDGRIGIY